MSWRADLEGQFPILLRLECHDLIVSLDTEPEGGGLAGAVRYHTVVQTRVLGLHGEERKKERTKF